ncbi:MAG TPA: gluconate 2-dehydrogenase subunit 3 family protein [Gemmatimonadaceae bacterium]|nr:gluconate 2-dehydrogenase subunit 3 family protein [Gemmatimonadaceae bacterium]
MDRRELLQTVGASALLALIPGEARAAWARVASGLRPSSGLSDNHLALVRALADSILPRTETPGATDVGVHRFVDVIVSENYDEGERDAFVAGLEKLDAAVMLDTGRVFHDLAPNERAAVLDAIEGGQRTLEPNRTYWRLKGLVIHGYFTSEMVMKDVLRHQVMPGQFLGDAPMMQPSRGQRG